MAILVLDSGLGARLKSERQRSDADHYDEVWDGVYVMPPMPNNEHQQIVIRVASIIQDCVGWPGLGDVLAGVNLSDREDGWEHNYRVPDVAVFLRGGRARNLGTHWQGGPEFLAEILSPNDQTRDKLPFYSLLGVREALLIDRDPWVLELYQLQNGHLVEIGRASLQQPAVLASAVLPLAFELVPGQARPFIKVTHRDRAQSWLV
jgi:Uma2 family endonuclease